MGYYKNYEQVDMHCHHFGKAIKITDAFFFSLSGILVQ